MSEAVPPADQYPAWVLVIYNAPVLPPDHPDYLSEADVLYSVKVVRESLTHLGIASEEYGVRDIVSFVEYLQQNPPQVIFNLYEGPANNAVTEVYLAGVLEWLEIPFTGSPSLALSLARDKSLAKKLFLASQVPTPRFHVLREEDPIPENPVGWPAIVKPAAEDASVGIEQDSVVTTQSALEAKVSFLRSHYGGSVLIEEFIRGRELHVSVVDLHGTGELIPLPLGEVSFEAPANSGIWPIYSYTAKWNENSEEYRHAAIKVNALVPVEVHNRLVQVAGVAFQTLSCRDYARVDARVTEQGDVYVLEVNPNPSIYSVLIDEGLPHVGATYDSFIGAMVRNAWQRKTRALARRRVTS